MRLRVAHKVVKALPDHGYRGLWYRETTVSRACARWDRRTRAKRWKTLPCGCRILWWNIPSCAGCYCEARKRAG